MTTGYEADHYVPRLDLGADPFAADFESEYFYGGAMRRQLLEQLVHFCRFTDQVVVLVGATGSGTSTLLDQACFQLEPLMDCCVISAEDAKAPEQMLLAISQQLRLSANAADNVHALVAELSASGAIADEAEPLLMLVDQAQYMALETFQLLQHLVDSANGLVRLLLAGEYQVEQLARLAGFQSEQIKLLELEPLGKTEVSDYLLGLLQSVGYAGEAPLDDDQIAVLQEQSGGNITELNQLLPDLLMADKPPTPTSSSFGLPVAHIVSIAVLVAILLVAIFYGGDSSEGQQGASKQAAVKSADQVSVPVALPANQLEPKVKAVLPTAQKLASKKPVTIDADKNEQAELVSTAAKEKANTAGAVQRGAGSLIGSKLVPKQSAAISTPPPSKTTAAKAAIKAEVTTVKKTIVEPAAKPIVAMPKPAPKPVAVVKKPAIVPPANAVPSREQRLLAYAEADYMLQLMGSVDEQRTRNFTKQYAGRLPITYFETRLKGKPWFVAVTGPYPDKLQALAAVKALPATLAKLKPWARSVASIQRDIRQNRDI